MVSASEAFDLPETLESDEPAPLAGEGARRVVYRDTKRRPRRTEGDTIVPERDAPEELRRCWRGCSTASRSAAMHEREREAERPELQPEPVAPAPPGPRILALQRSVGNQAVTAMLSRQAPMRPARRPPPRPRRSRASRRACSRSSRRCATRSRRSCAAMPSHEVMALRWSGRSDSLSLRYTER